MLTVVALTDQLTTAADQFTECLLTPGPIPLQSKELKVSRRRHGGPLGVTPP